MSYYDYYNQSTIKDFKDLIVKNYTVSNYLNYGEDEYISRQVKIDFENSDIKMIINIVSDCCGIGIGDFRYFKNLIGESITEFIEVQENTESSEQKNFLSEKYIVIEDKDEEAFGKRIIRVNNDIVTIRHGVDDCVETKLYLIKTKEGKIYLPVIGFSNGYYSAYAELSKEK